MTRQNVTIRADSRMILYLLRMKFFLGSFFLFSPSYSSVPAVHLITTVYMTVVRTRTYVYVREAGGVAASSFRLFCQDISVQCVYEGECVSVLRHCYRFVIIMFSSPPPPPIFFLFFLIFNQQQSARCRSFFHSQRIKMNLEFY